MNGYGKVKKDEIICIQSSDQYSEVILKGEKVYSRLNLKKSMETLNSSKFYLVHRSYLINLDQVKQVSEAKEGVVVMSNKDEIPIARGKRVELLAKLNLK